MTITEDYENYPSANNFPGDGTEVVYEEGQFVGYRYFKQTQKPVTYEFGYGLSYTDFTYKNCKVDRTLYDEEINVSVEVINSGEVSGREVVQVYIKNPVSSLNKPEWELKGFAKTRLLQPGESEEVKIKLNHELLKSYCAGTARWIIQPGSYEVCVGASCLDIRGRAEFTVPSEITVQQVSNKLVADRKATNIQF